MVRRPEPLTPPAERFTSPLHDERVAAWLGMALGLSFGTAFATGLFSHFMQHPPDWMYWPSRPVNLYRVTQGLHVIGGLATIPLLLAKLWTVYPKLLQWPPVRSVGHAIERALILLLVGASLFQLATGLFNIAYWYPFPFFFPTAHYWTAYILMGALVIHVANEWAKVRRTVMTRPEDTIGRRRFLLTVAAAGGAVTVTTVGETFTPLADLAVLAPRRPGVGPQALPVNKTAQAAGIARVGPSWRLQVQGPVDLTFSLQDLHTRFPAHTARLPIACVEGWSASGTWEGVRLRDILRTAGAPEDARVRIESMERGGLYRTSWVDPPHWHDPLTLLALRLNGSPLDLDHGHPCRLIAPNRPGVQQTKWVHRLVIT
ncbi:molybdopterin-dependent oxidoreductase [Spirillospora sp. NPDC029432]|uniref:molybdopterin-dependent oxidoreductase n=1 Tax=Spirillospora sp. NPDC029432 TaxID=3154599 RepID=UPI003456BB7F